MAGHDRKHVLVAIGLATAFFGLVTLLGSRERPWADARIMYEVAEDIVAGKGIQVRTLHPPLSQRGVGDKVYSLYALAPSLIHVPGVVVRDLVLYKLSPRGRPLSLVLTAHLANSLIGAATCALFFLLALRLGASRGSALLATVMVGCATMVWVYTRSTYSEPLQALCALGLCAELIRITHLGETTRTRGLLFGAWAGGLFNAKAVFALSIAAGALWLAIALRKQRRELGRVLLWACPTGVPLLIAFLLYNQFRWGNPLETGYTGYANSLGSQLNENILVGLWGQLFSFGKSIFLYSPPLILAAVVSWPYWRAHRRIGLSVAAVCLPVLFLYARYLSWSGDYCWGPRYTLYLIAPVMLAVPWWLDRVRERIWLRRSVFASFMVVGCFVQLLGASFYWGHAVRISMAGRREWLGAPNRAGSKIPARFGICDSCFEDMHGHIWLPPFNPILEHWWLMRHVPFQHSWETARKDAPWRRHTSLDLDSVKASYLGVGLDYWILRYERPQRGVAVVGSSRVDLQACKLEYSIVSPK